MTTTTFTYSLVSTNQHGFRGPKDKKSRFTLAFPAQWTAAGLSLDLTKSTIGNAGGFDKVTEYSFGPGSLITDGEVVLHLFGTKSSDGSIATSDLKVGAHWGGGAGALLDSVGTDDLSAIVALALTVHGY